MAGDIECNWCCEAASYRVSLPLIGLSAKLYPLLQTIVLVVSMAALLCMLNRSCKCPLRSHRSPHLPCCHCCCGNDTAYCNAVFPSLDARSYAEQQKPMLRLMESTRDHNSPVAGSGGASGSHSTSHKRRTPKRARGASGRLVRPAYYTYV